MKFTVLKAYNLVKFVTVHYNSNIMYASSIVQSLSFMLQLGSEDEMEIAHGVSQGIELICHCNFPSVYIVDEKLTCEEENPHLAIFSGHIISTNDRDSSDLVGDLEEWVSSGPTVVVQGKELRVVSSETSPDARSDDKDSDEEQDSNLLGIVVGTVVPVIILLLLISAVVIGIFLFRWRVKR